MDGRAGGRPAGGLGRPLTFIQANCIIPISTRARTQGRSSIFTVSHSRRMKTIRPCIQPPAVVLPMSERRKRKKEETGSRPFVESRSSISKIQTLPPRLGGGIHCYRFDKTVSREAKNDADDNSFRAEIARCSASKSNREEDVEERRE